jgi:hypothetical protein
MKLFIETLIYPLFQNFHRIMEKHSQLDPFEALCDANELIFQHLSGKDVLNFFLVSTEWNRRTSACRDAMKKVKLVFRDIFAKSPSPKEVTALLQSQRHYQNFDGNFRLCSNIARKFLLLERFSQSLVNLKISTRPSHQMLTENLSFPKLKTVDVRCLYGGSCASLLFKGATKVEKLTITTWNMNDELVECVMQKRNLKELNFCLGRENIFNVHSLQDWSTQPSSALKF